MGKTRRIGLIAVASLLWLPLAACSGKSTVCLRNSAGSDGIRAGMRGAASCPDLRRAGPGRKVAGHAGETCRGNMKYAGPDWEDGGAGGATGSSGGTPSVCEGISSCPGWKAPTSRTMTAGAGEKTAGAPATPGREPAAKARWPYDLTGIPFLNEFRRYPDGAVEHSICGIYSMSRDASGSVERMAGPWPLFESERRDGIAHGRFLFPFGTFRDAPDETRVSLPPVVFWRSREISGETSGREADFMLFPLLFAGSSDRRGPYFTLVPLGGTLKGKLGKEHILHVLFPLFAVTKEPAYTACHAIFPFFAAWKGKEQWGFRALPVYACDHKKGRFSRHHVLWPFFRFQREGLDTRAPMTIVSLLPLFDVARSANHNHVSVLWPFFQHTWRLKDGFRETHAPWPFFSVTRGRGISGIKFWPFYCRRDGETVRSKFVMWPFYRRQRVMSEGAEEIRQYFCFVSYRIERTEKQAAATAAEGPGAGAPAEPAAGAGMDAGDAEGARREIGGAAVGNRRPSPAAGSGNSSDPDAGGAGSEPDAPPSEPDKTALRTGKGAGTGDCGQSGAGRMRREIIWKIWPFFRWKGDSGGYSEFKCLAPFWMEGGEDAVEAGPGRLWNIYWRRRLPDGSETSRAFLRLYESRKSASGGVHRRIPLVFEYFGRRRPGDDAAIDRDLSVGGGLLWRYRSVEGERVCGNFLFDYRRVSDGTARSRRFRILYGLFGFQTGADAHIRILFVPFDRKGLRTGRGGWDREAPGGPYGGDTALPPPPVPVTIGHLDGPDGGRFVRGSGGRAGETPAASPDEAAASGRSGAGAAAMDGPARAASASEPVRKQPMESLYDQQSPLPGGKFWDRLLITAVAAPGHLDDVTDQAEERKGGTSFQAATEPAGCRAAPGIASPPARGGAAGPE
ncbi:MAG: hypothetical protein N3A38_07200 [Planctomycetota bacterium]|nr:hypothetical protein [Planctomycetota bacterium]